MGVRLRLVRANFKLKYHSSTKEPSLKCVLFSVELGRMERRRRKQQRRRRMKSSTLIVSSFNVSLSLSVKPQNIFGFPSCMHHVSASSSLILIKLFAIKTSREHTQTTQTNYLRSWILSFFFLFLLSHNQTANIIILLLIKSPDCFIVRRRVSNKWVPSSSFWCRRKNSSQLSTLFSLRFNVRRLKKAQSSGQRQKIAGAKTEKSP